MSAEPVGQQPLADRPVEVAEMSSAPGPVEVRRNARVAAMIGAAASASAIAYLWRAVGSGSSVDWLICAVMATLAVTYLRGLFDARTPLLVVDELGVRVRLGSQWRGLPWEAVDSVAVTPRRGLLRDGKLVVGLDQPKRAAEGLEGRGRRNADLNHKLYGAPLAVPLGLTTKVTGGKATGLPDRIAALAHGRAEVVTVVDRAEQQPDPAEPARVESDQQTTSSPAEPALVAEAPDAAQRPRWTWRRGSTALVEVGPEGTGEEPPQEPEPLRREPPALHRLDAAGSRVRAIARLGEPVAPLVIEDFAPEPAYDPVIGPELAAARTRVGLSVDELAERTRIRPHVIESIEVDDFAACGGDFYARGHIRTLARVLGKDPAPMLAQFEERYATAPVTARRVFEAELTTGMTGSRRKTVGGPSWALLIGTVLVLALVWTVVRLVGGGSEPVLEDAPPMLGGSAVLGKSAREPAPVRAVTTVLAATGGGTHVVVRDRTGVVFTGDLVLGQVQRVRAQPPVTVSSDDGGALTVTVGGRDRGALGADSRPAPRTFRVPPP